MSTFDPVRMAAELDWLKKHPEFDERPATIREFIGPQYLNIEGKVRPAVMLELEGMVGEKVYGNKITQHPLAMFTGGIGIGKTTIASIILPYLAHWVLCLHDPQEFFDLLPGSRIAFMQMSTSGNQAKEVVFGDIKARIEHSKWFQTNYPYDTKFKNQLRFSKDIWILPGDSEETTFEGYNILGGILDEADSHKVTKEQDYAELGFNTIHSRITSRFGNRGFLLVIGQMKRANGFAARKYKELQADSQAYTVRMAIWESFGWNRFLKPDGTRDSFWYDTKRHEIIPTGVAELLGSKRFLEIPNVYRKDFTNNPEKALRDLAGIPPATDSPFITLTYKITEARARWINMHGPQGPVDSDNRLSQNFYADTSLKRVCHIDIAFSPDGDALGFAMGHVPQLVEFEGELKPFIMIDMIMRIHAPAGREIFLSDIRQMIYLLRSDRKFKIVKATMDGFQSTDTMQQLERRRIITELVSIDKQLAPYYDLREALHENRIAFPPYIVKLHPNDLQSSEILVKELTELVDDGVKVDHPPEGSKDVADAVAGVTYTLMGDRTYHKRNMTAPGTPSEAIHEDSQQQNQNLSHPAVVGSSGINAPIPPTMDLGLWRPPTPGR